MKIVFDHSYWLHPSARAHTCVRLGVGFWTFYVVFFIFQFVMYNEGDVVRSVDLVDAASGRLTQLFRKVRSLMARSAATPEILFKDRVILMEVLKVYN